MLPGKPQYSCAEEAVLEWGGGSLGLLALVELWRMAAFKLVHVVVISLFSEDDSSKYWASGPLKEKNQVSEPNVCLFQRCHVL